MYCYDTLLFWFFKSKLATHDNMTRFQLLSISLFTTYLLFININLNDT